MATFQQVCWTNGGRGRRIDCWCESAVHHSWVGTAGSWWGGLTKPPPPRWRRAYLKSFM